MIHYVDPRVYEKYRDEVLRHSGTLIQGSGRKGLTDAEIAAKLGIPERDVTEIRVILFTRQESGKRNRDLITYEDY